MDDIATSALSFKSRGVQKEEIAFLQGELKDSRFIIEKKDQKREKGDLKGDVKAVSKVEEEDEGIAEDNTKSLIDFDDIFNSTGEDEKKSKKRAKTGPSTSSFSSSSGASDSSAAVNAAFGTSTSAGSGYVDKTSVKKNTKNKGNMKDDEVITPVTKTPTSSSSASSSSSAASSSSSLSSTLTSATVTTEKKKPKKDKNHESTVPVPVGLSLKQQLERFKLKLASGDKSSVVTVGVKDKDEEEDEEESSEMKVTEGEYVVDGVVEGGIGGGGKGVGGGGGKGGGGEGGEGIGVMTEMDMIFEESKVYVPVQQDEPIGADGRVLKKILTEKEQQDLEKANKKGKKKGYGVPGLKNQIVLNRDSKIQAARLNLPVCGMEQEIVEAITLNDVVILCGETGSGKSTQVPQFLFEAGYGQHGMIGITQPRRVAATSTAERVGVEMGEPINAHGGNGNSGNSGNNGNNVKQEGKNKKQKNKKNQSSCNEGKEGKEEKEGEEENEEKEVVKQGSLVGYQIRFDASTVGDRTKIKFMTDGILLREVTSDLLLRQYTVILLDEAHERNVNTDILLGMISR